MNRLKMFLLLALLVSFAGCSKDYFGDNPTKNPKSPARINFSAPNLFPEGLTFDPLHNVFLVSSAAFGTVGVVDFSGAYKELTTDANLTGTTGLKVDKSRKRLWVCNIENGVGVYDLNSGHKIFFTDVSALLPGKPVFMNDVAIAPDGNAYVTNSSTPVIYKIDQNGKASVFFQKAAFATGPDEFGFNGIQYDSHGFLLVTHTAQSQIIKIPVNNPDSYSVVNLSGGSLSLPDGLLLSKDGKQLVVVNEDRVLSFTSNDQWKTGSLSTTYITGADVFASSLTSDGKRVFVIYSHLDKLLSGESQDTFAIQEVPLLKQTDF